MAIRRLQNPGTMRENFVETTKHKASVREVILVRIFILQIAWWYQAKMVCPSNFERRTANILSVEYDPKNALLVDTAQMSPNSNHQSMVNGQRGSGHRGRGRGDRGGFVARRNRAEFSHSGPNNDRSITTIVVEQIPEEKFDEQSVRDFFSEFGDIEEVTMQPYKRLALVKYGNYQGARGAYDSPKVIFDNRFVKVYWYKPGNLPTPPSTAKPGAGSPSASTAEEQPFDREEFERNAQIAQKKLEEKKAQMKETDAKRQALEELAQKQADEKKRLLEKIAAKGGGAVSMTDAKTEDKNGTDNNKASAHTKALRAKVAELEAEAKSLGLDSALSDGHTPRGRGRGRGRGSYRGWEGFAGRGSYDSHRANPRGRGSFRGQGGGKYNLDNRTKKVGVSGVEMTTEKDEALRQHLLVSLNTGISLQMHGMLMELQLRASANSKPSNLILTDQNRRSSPLKTALRLKASCTAPKTSPLWAKWSSPGSTRLCQLFRCQSSRRSLPTEIWRGAV